MSTLTTLLSLIKPGGADTVDIAQINSNMDTLDAKYGGARIVANAAARTALVGFQGQHVIETDTNDEYVYVGGAWRYLGYSGKTVSSLTGANVCGVTSFTASAYNNVTYITPKLIHVAFRLDPTVAFASQEIVIGAPPIPKPVPNGVNRHYPACAMASVNGGATTLYGMAWDVAQSRWELTTSNGLSTIVSAGAANDYYIGNMTYEIA